MPDPVASAHRSPRVRASSSAVSTRSEPSRWRCSSALGIASMRRRRAARVAVGSGGDEGSSSADATIPRLRRSGRHASADHHIRPSEDSTCLGSRMPPGGGASSPSPGSSQRSLIALGAAGLVAGHGHPGTAGADRAASHDGARSTRSRTPRSTPSRRDLRALSASVAALGDQARGASPRCRATRPMPSTRRSRPATQLVADIDAADRTDPRRPRRWSRSSARTRPRTSSSPEASRGTPPASTASSRPRRLESAWARLTVGSRRPRTGCRPSSPPTMRPSSTRQQQGREGRVRRRHSRTSMTPTRPSPTRDDLRDRLQATVDVATLDEWLDRSARLRRRAPRLCTTRSRRGGRVNDTVREAMRRGTGRQGPAAAGHARLVLIMADIGRAA